MRLDLPRVQKCYLYYLDAQSACPWQPNAAHGLDVASGLSRAETAMLGAALAAVPEASIELGLGQNITTRNRTAGFSLWLHLPGQAILSTHF